MILRTYDSRADWLKARQACVSSTESAALFGMSPWTSAFELANRKAQKLPETEGDARMAWGQRLEAAIAQGIADDYGVIIESLELAYAVHPNRPRMGSSFDYMIVDAKEREGGFSELGTLFKKHGSGLLEIKNVDALVYRDWPEHDAPDHIEIQVQHELEVSQLAWCALGVLVGGNRTELYTRERDPVVGAVIAAKIEAFWVELEQGIFPPPVMPEDAEIIIKLHSYAEPNKVFDGQANATLLDLCKQYEAFGIQARHAQDQQQMMKALILETIGDSERALIEGYNLSAAMVAPTEVKAYVRNGYRNFRLTKKRANGKA